MKKNNTAEKALLEAEQITKALKEGTEKTLKNIVNEAINDMMKDDDADAEEEPIEDDNVNVNDVEDEEVPEVTDVEDDAEADEEDAEAEEGAEEPEEGEAEEDDADNLEDFKVGDNEYDLTGVDGDEILDILNSLDDDDECVVVKNGEDDFDVECDADADENELSDDEEEIDLELDDEEPEDDEAELDLELDDEEPEGGDDELELDLDDEDDDEEEALNEENLGYTDSYQKDFFANKFNMSEPAEGMNNWDEGAPKGAEKPWAGEGDGKPFEKAINETLGAPKEKSTAKTLLPKNKKENGPKAKHGISTAGEGYVGTVDESVKRIVAKAKAIQAENKQYKQMINGIKAALCEAAILNVNYGKIVSLLVNESATKDEKKAIVERFNNVKTIKEGTELYNSIKRELNEAKKSTPIFERTIQSNSSKTLNETTIYTPKNNASLNLMERMDGLFKKH